MTPVIQPNEESFLTFLKRPLRKQSEAAEYVLPDSQKSEYEVCLPELDRRVVVEKEMEQEENKFRLPNSVRSEQSRKQTLETDASKSDTRVRIQIGNLAPESNGFALPPAISLPELSPAVGLITKNSAEIDDIKPLPLFLYSPLLQASSLSPDVFALEPIAPNKVTSEQFEAVPTLLLQDDSNRMIGTLTLKERKEKIRKYLEKRKRRIWRKKICYDCRKKVADKRLRVKGRFVTRDQACNLLGTTPEDLSKNELLMDIIKSNSGCSIVTSARNMKIRNIQTLLLPLNKQIKEHSQPPLKVELVKENDKEQVVEVKIEAFGAKRVSENQRRDSCSKKIYKLPAVIEPVFALTKAETEVIEKHKRYHLMNK